MTDHKSIHAALVAAKGGFAKAVKDAVNPLFRSRYAALSSIIDAVQPSLLAEGIALYWVEEEKGDGDSLRTYQVTVLHHAASGTEIRCPVRMLLGKRDMQGLGSAKTYARRYGLQDACGIATDEDDDGNAATQQQPQRQRQPRPRPEGAHRNQDVGGPQWP